MTEFASSPVNSLVVFTTGDGSIGVMSSPTTLIAPRSAPATAGPSHHTPRLRLKPKGPATGYVDGAWWPLSGDLAAELPALLAVLAVRPGAIERVAYQLTAWNSAPRRITADGHPVRLEGFGSQPAHTVAITGQGRQRLILLVLPPGLPETTAHQILMLAADRDNTDSPGLLLATSPAEPSDTAGQRWEGDGGRVG